MENARYHRAQAELCLEIARHLSDPAAAGLMRTAAARHFEQAVVLEALSTAPSGISRGDDTTRDDFSDSFYYRAIRTQIGEALRSELLPTEPASDRFLELLLALDQSKGGQGASEDACLPEQKSTRSEGTDQ